jgi:hypothetical protein
MGPGGKLFELLDLPKLASPNVLNLNAAQTALNLVERAGASGFMSYASVWSELENIVRGLATDHYIRHQFNIYSESWKNESLRGVVRLLNDVVGGKGVWYPDDRKPKYFLGCWFKPSIKGFWHFERQAYAVLINARKSQPLSLDDIRFLARGVFEFYCAGDPNRPMPLIIDLSEHRKGHGREGRYYPVADNEAAPREAFSHSVSEFVSALNLAGISTRLPPDNALGQDLFAQG